jgi:imidazolonepropionase
VRTVDLLVLDASQVVTVAAGTPGPARGTEVMNDLGVVDDASVAIDRGRILAIGPTNEITRLFRSTRRVHVAGRAVLPGFVDAHTHPAFSAWREGEFALRCRGASYEAILASGGGILASAKALQRTSENDLVEHLRATFEHMSSHGTTTVEAKSGYGLTPESEAKSLRAIRRAAHGAPVTVVRTFLGAHAIPAAYARTRAAYVRLLVDTMIPRVARERLAQFCDVFCDEAAFTPREAETVLRAGIAHGLRAKVHADEIHDTGGAALAAKVGAVSAEHLGAANPAGIRALAKKGVVPVLLPTTTLFLGLKKRPDARAMIDAGCAVALATDFNPGTSPTANLALAASLGCTTLGLTPEEAVTAITRNGAAALGMADRVGFLAPGMRADLVVIDAPSYVHLPYRLGTNLVRTVIRHGIVVVHEGRRVPA